MSEQVERETPSQRLCPYCEEPFDSQGLYMHVRNTSGGGHRDRNEVPDGFNPREAPIYDPEGDNETIEADLAGEADEHDIGQKKLYHCLWCSGEMKGKSALSIHLTKSAGDELHPEDASTGDDMFFTVPADENWNSIMDDETVEEIERRERRDRMVQEQLGTDDYEVIQESNSMQAQQLSSAEVEQRRQEIVIPQDATKVEQVAAVLTQEERFYDHPDIVSDMVNASRTTFYEGRKLFDNTGGIDVDSREGGESESAGEESVADAVADAEEGITVMVGDQKFVPFEALQEVADATTEAAEEIVARYR